MSDGVESQCLKDALALAELGFSVIPVPGPRRNSEPGRAGDGKVPSISWAEFQHRRASEAELRGWFRHEQNSAIVTGAISGVVVVDADSPSAHAWVIRNLPRTPRQTRTGKGFHCFYRHPGVEVRNRARLQTRDGRIYGTRSSSRYVTTRSRKR
jgi:hypothetical protein